MFKKEPITITEEQFIKTAAKATEKFFDETKDLEIILPMVIMASLISRELFHAGGRGRLMAMWRLSNDRRCTC